MPSLLDIAPSTRTVTVQGVALPVTGVSAQGIAVLFERFPIFRDMFAGKAADIGLSDAIKLAPGAIAAVIACGTGSPGDLKAEAVANNLPAQEQAELLEAILEQTMPRGFGPFVETVVKLFGVVGTVGDGTTQGADTKSESQ